MYDGVVVSVLKPKRHSSAMWSFGHLNVLRHERVGFPQLAPLVSPTLHRISI